MHRAHVARQGSWRVPLPPWCGCGLPYGAQKRMLVPGRAVRWARQQPLRAHSVGILWKCAKISLKVFSAIEASLPFTKAAAAPRARSRYLLVSMEASMPAILAPQTARTDSTPERVMRQPRTLSCPWLGHTAKQVKSSAPVSPTDAL